MPVVARVWELNSARASCPKPGVDQERYFFTTHQPGEEYLFVKVAPKAPFCWQQPCSTLLLAPLRTQPTRANFALASLIQEEFQVHSTHLPAT